MKVEIVPAEPSHIPIMLSCCREREREAYEELTHNKAETFLKSMIRDSAEAWSGFIDDEYACMLIISRGSILGDSATVYLQTCEAVDAHPFVFLRHSQIRLAELRKRYHYIHGVVQADNEQSIKWLRWLGFKFGEPEFFGDYLLRKFSMVS